jgi:hypothetical protein
MLTKVRLRIKVSFVRVCYEILRFRYRCYSGNHDNPICWIHILLSLIKKKPSWMIFSIWMSEQLFLTSKGNQ